MNLQLSLKTKWFEMTKAGIKTEDYREITPYWASRLFNKTDKNMTIYFWKGFLGKRGEYEFRDNEQIDFIIKTVGFKSFKTNTMTLGYPKASDNERIIKLEHSGIEIRTGNPEWGAEPNKLYFVIKHGNRIA